MCCKQRHHICMVQLGQSSHFVAKALQCLCTAHFGLLVRYCLASVLCCQNGALRSATQGVFELQVACSKAEWRVVAQAQGCCFLELPCSHQARHAAEHIRCDHDAADEKVKILHAGRPLGQTRAGLEKVEDTTAFAHLRGPGFASLLAAQRYTARTWSTQVAVQGAMLP